MLLLIYAQITIAVIIVPHNLTNKFQPLDITVNKSTKCFIKEKYKNGLQSNLQAS